MLGPKTVDAALRGFQKTIDQLRWIEVECSERIGNIMSEKTRLLEYENATRQERERALKIAAKLEALVSEDG